MKETDLWKTPRSVIDYVENAYGKIDIDLAASEFDKVCMDYICERENLLDKDNLRAIDDKSNCWLNPPYSTPKPFVKVAIELAKLGHNVTMLLNMDTSTTWFELINKHATVISPVVGGRIAFLNKDNEPVPGNNKPQVLVHLSKSPSQAWMPIHISELQIKKNKQRT